MSDPKTHTAQSADTIDWAEKLKASMNESLDERTTPTPAPTAEEDDLAALLRAQLARRSPPAEALMLDLNTDDFEEDDKPSFETAEHVYMEEDEIENESEAEESSDDLPWDEDDDVPVPLPDAAMITVYTADEAGKSSENSEVGENLQAEDSSDDLPWDEDDDTPAPISEPAMITVYTADGTEDDAKSASAEEPEVYEPPISIPARGYTFEPVPYEEEQELPSPDGDVGDLRLLAAYEASTLLLKEEGLHIREEQLYEAGSAEQQEDAPAEAVPTVPVKSPKPAPSLQADPLQLGLDDILPRVEAQASPEPPVADPPADSARYSTRMIRDHREEAVRDAEIYLHLGYEEQMTRSEQQDAMEEARRRAQERENKVPRNETSPVKVRCEYTDRKQTPAIEQAYVRTRRACFTRLCVAAVGALFGILHDYLGALIMRSISSMTYADSRLYPAIGTLWTVLICLPFLSRLGRGLKSLFDFEPTRYAVSALALLVAIAHGVLEIFAFSPYLYGGVALFMLAVAAASEYVDTVAEHRAFSVVSSGKTAFVLTDEVTPASAAHAETAPSERTLTAVRAGRVSDYFARTGRYNPYMGRLNYLLPVSLLAAIICAGVAVLRGGSLLHHGVPVFTATYLSCLPAAYLTAMSLPLFRANGILRGKGAAVIGTAAPVDYGKKGSTRLLIRDGDALGGLYRKEITLRDDPNADLWRGKAACLFRLLECPLWNESPLGDDNIDGLCVEVAEAEDGYARLYLIDLRTNETTEIMMGRREALSRRGVRLPKASMERVYKKTEASQVMYLAFDRRFRIAYAVEYRMGRTFARAVEKLASMGDKAALVTYDPLVSPALLKHDRIKNCPAVELLRPAYTESVRASRSSGVIATGRSLDLLYPYAACRRMRRAYRLSHVIGWLAIPTAVGLSLLAVFLTGDVISSAAVTAWQIILTVVSVAVSFLTVTQKSQIVSSDISRKKAKESSATDAPTHAEPAKAHSAASAKPQTKTDKDHTIL